MNYIKFCHIQLILIPFKTGYYSVRRIKLHGSYNYDNIVMLFTVSTYYLISACNAKILQQ